MMPSNVEMSFRIEEGPVQQNSADQYEQRVLAMMFRMADYYRNSHNLRQAMEMYFKMVDEYPDAPEARLARERLLEIAEHYENRGDMRQARAICEKLR